jgi:4a-hydroxytetrahydrobiopterin dehydratase
MNSIQESNAPLAEQRCAACEGGVESLSADDVDRIAATLEAGWRVVDGHHLLRTFKFKDFKSALAFTNRVGELAEEEGHHPDITLGWGKAEITLYTHAVDGLTQNDFILAAKISRLKPAP